MTNEDKYLPDGPAPLDEEQVGERIRAAGRRSEPPAADLAAARETAETAWRQLVAEQRRRRARVRAMSAIAASLLAVAIGGAWWMRRPEPAAAEPLATVELGPQDSLASGETIDAREPLALRMVAGQSLRLEAGSRLHLVSRSRVELERGAVYVDSGSLAGAAASIVVGTPRGAVREIGTQYEVRLADSSRGVVVRVREGRVAVEHDGASEEAGRGEELVLSSDGAITRGRVEPDGPQWAWVLAAAPPLDIEGCTLARYLDWVARETGKRVLYGDAELASSARAIVLHGTIEDLQPDESLGVIIEGAGLEHRVEAGTILVFRTRT